MNLSTPIYRLKHRAKTLSREKHIPLNAALDQVANTQGFESWSLLAAKSTSVDANPASILTSLNPGDLLLLGARPGQGKTILGLKLISEAARLGRRSTFFTLEYTSHEARDRFQSVGDGVVDAGNLASFDESDAINAEYIISQLKKAETGTVAVIDYLQLLDQKRHNPELTTQIQELKTFARKRGVIMIFLSQIDRSYDPTKQRTPDLSHVRLPNPLDLTLFSKSCFLHGGQIQVRTIG